MPKSKRTRTGCLCCRRRHKKCDELKPSCKFCISKGLKCEWPIKGSIFVNYQSNTTTTPNNSSFDSDQSQSSDSRKSSIDENLYKLSNNVNTNNSLPPIKHYHMVIPREHQYTSTIFTSPQTSPTFKEMTFNSINSEEKNPNSIVPMNFNTSKRLSVDSLLN